jgi:metal-responsive CopG/Arc/MetJ family transcriptional regulator
VIRTTISLPDDLAAALAREARQRGTSVSQIVREAVEIRLGRAASERKIPFAALGRSGHTDTSERIEELLAEEWTKEHLVDCDR